MENKDKYYANAEVIKDHFDKLGIKYRDFEGKDKNRVLIPGLSVAYLTKMLSSKKNIRKNFSLNIYEKLARELTKRYNSTEENKTLTIDPDTLIDHKQNTKDKKIIFYLEKYEYCDFSLGFDSLMVFNEARVTSMTSRLIEVFINNLRNVDHKIKKQFTGYLSAEEQVAKIKAYADINENIDLLKKENINVYLGINNIPQIIWTSSEQEDVSDGTIFTAKPLFSEIRYAIVMFSDNNNIDYFKIKYSPSEESKISEILKKYPTSIKHKSFVDEEAWSYPQTYDNVEHQKIVSKIAEFYMRDHHNDLLNYDIDSGDLPFAWNYSESIEPVFNNEKKVKNDLD